MEEFDVEKYREEGDKMAERIMEKYLNKKAEKTITKQQEEMQRV